jgi:3-deoxy-manno-octulosonate cytidylyltransferase (CMP-KDO synthetase)
LQAIAIIPARYRSSRFPGKPLVLIAGKPMIQHVWDRVALCRGLAGAVVATDDATIAETCTRLGIDVEMTSNRHETGTDRLAEVALRRPADIYVNVQGDEPLIEPAAIDAVTRCLVEAVPRGIGVATGYIEGATPEQEASTSSVHLVPTLDGCVLTFSRLPVPCAFQEPYRRTIHVGLYAFTGPALAAFAARPRGPVERAESIELMRYLEYGDRIACVAVPPGSIGVDRPADVARVEAVLAGRRQ